MLKNYIKIALRNIIKNKVYSVINILGLATGMAAFILIALWVQNEISYDDFHENGNSIYRLVNNGKIAGETRLISTSSGPMGPTMVNEYPEVLNSVRIVRGKSKSLISSESNITDNLSEKKFYESQVYFADDTIFEIFTFPFIKGDPSKALKDPNSIVITKAISEKYFGNSNVIGEVLRFQNEQDLTVTGIIENVPQNSHLKFDFLIPMKSRLAKNRFPQKWWINFGFQTFLLLDKNTSISKLESKFPDFVERNMRNSLNKAGMEINPFLQPLNEIHLQSNFEFEFEPNGDIKHVYIFSTIAILILLIACINYINLSTSQSDKRATEIGLRKIVGANRKQIAKQFLSESFIISVVSMLVGIFLIELFLPLFQNITGKQITFDIWSNGILQIVMIGFIIAIGLMSGSYPAIYFSSTKPLKIIKGNSQYLAQGRKSLLRKGLIVFQFTISLILIIGSIVAFKQLEYFKNKKLGFTKDHVVVLPINYFKLRDNYESAKNELSSNPNVLSVTATSQIPGDYLAPQLFIPEDAINNNSKILSMILSDKDYLNTFGLNLTSGRNFAQEHQASKFNSVILNETAVKSLGWKDPIGRKLKWYATGEELEVIGVIKDYHISSLHNNIEPLAIHIMPKRFSYFVLKISSTNIVETLKIIESKYTELDPYHPFEYFFLDQSFNSLYKAEEKFETIFNLFTFLAIFISCLGLFGLTSYIIENRTKEIGIRKVLGASIFTILKFLNKEFLLLILISNILAWPIAWYFMNNWLNNFAYRIEMKVLTFLIAGVLVITIALATISAKAIKAAMANPVDSLRNE